MVNVILTITAICYLSYLLLDTFNPFNDVKGFNFIELYHQGMKLLE